MSRKQQQAMFANMKKGGARSNRGTGDEYDTSKPWINNTTPTNPINGINNDSSVKPSNAKKQSHKNEKNDGRKTDTKLTLEQKIIQKEIRAMIKWSGCAAFPQHCMIIEGVNAAYDLYKIENRDFFQNIVKNVTPHVIDPMFENSIDIYSDSIFKIISNRGFIDNIPIEIKFDENIFQDMIQGTISNMTKNSTKALIDYTVDKI